MLILLACANIILHPKTEQLLIVLHCVDLYGDKYLFSFKDLFSLGLKHQDGHIQSGEGQELDTTARSLGLCS